MKIQFTVSDVGYLPYGGNRSCVLAIECGRPAPLLTHAMRQGLLGFWAFPERPRMIQQFGLDAVRELDAQIDNAIDAADAARRA